MKKVYRKFEQIHEIQLYDEQNWRKYSTDLSKKAGFFLSELHGI